VIFFTLFSAYCQRTLQFDGTSNRRLEKLETLLQYSSLVKFFLVKLIHFVTFFVLMCQCLYTRVQLLPDTVNGDELIVRKRCLCVL